MNYGDPCECLKAEILDLTEEKNPHDDFVASEYNCYWDREGGIGGDFCEMLIDILNFMLQGSAEETVESESDFLDNEIAADTVSVDSFIPKEFSTDRRQKSTYIQKAVSCHFHTKVIR